MKLSIIVIALVQKGLSCPSLGITKEYHYQKLSLESRKVCHTLVYLATLLHSNNAKDVKEHMAYIRKNAAKVFAARTSSLH